MPDPADAEGVEEGTELLPGEAVTPELDPTVEIPLVEIDSKLEDTELLLPEEVALEVAADAELDEPIGIRTPVLTTSSGLVDDQEPASHGADTGTVAVPST